MPALRNLGGGEAGAVNACGLFALPRIFDEIDISCSSELTVKCAITSAYDVNPFLRVAGFRSAGVGNGRSSHRALPGNVDWIKANPSWRIYRAFRFWSHLGPVARAAAPRGDDTLADQTAALLETLPDEDPPTRIIGAHRRAAMTGKCSIVNLEEFGGAGRFLLRRIQAALVLALALQLAACASLLDRLASTCGMSDTMDEGRNGQS